MINKEAKKIIRVAKAEIEWNYPLDYQIAFECAIRALEKMEHYERLVRELADTGFICEQMSIDSSWCESYCEPGKPDIECVEHWLEWSDE